MPYSNFILQQGEYTYSANIQFDIENDKKLARFIPNETTIDLLRRYFTDIAREKPAVHSRILYGSYGTGKSHFLTVLSLLLSKSHIDGIAYNTFLRRVRNYDELLANDIQSFVTNDKRKPYLIVPIVFDFDDFERSIYFSLRKTLERHNLSVKFKTFYTYALTLISQWKATGDSMARLVDACKKGNTTIDKLETQLSSFNKKSEKVFRAVFSSMTYGVEFLYEASNLTENLNEANAILQSKYSGMVFVFDEFGRYLEDNIKTVKVKAVQDLAEYCDHSGYNDHLILVSHKEIGQYTKAYGKAVADEWKKVEGRFQATPINYRQDQCLSLVQNILEKDADQWAAFQEAHREEFDRIYTEAVDFKGFLLNSALGDNPFQGGFPLHPITLFALDKLSKKVAQNERTFFTYLASSEEQSLRSFLERTPDNEFHFVGIDEIYDYFEPNIRAVQSDASYDWYRKLASALSKAKLGMHDNSAETKILKLLTVVGVINDGSTICADKKTILSGIDENNETLVKAISDLIAKKIIKYNGPNDRYEFFDGSTFDVEKMLEEEMNRISGDLVCATLNDNFIDFVLYPHRYNEQFKIKRVFIPIFVMAKDLERVEAIKQIPSFYDGILAMVLATPNDNMQEIVEYTTKIPRVLALINQDCAKIEYEVKKFIAILCLEAKKDVLMQKDPAIETELSYCKQEQFDVVSQLLKSWTSLENKTVYVAHNGVIHEEYASFEDVGELASVIMHEAYPHTLIVNNELINKNTLSGTISAAKKTAIRAILKGDHAENYYGLPYLSPEYICVRSVLAKNRLYLDENILDANLAPENVPSANALNCMINDYINQFKNSPTPFGNFYTALKAPPYGLREGYLSLLLAYVLMPYRKSLIISSHEIDQEITAELFEEIIKRPNDFSIYITNLSTEQLRYLDKLESMFSEFIDSKLLSRNRLKAIYDGMFLQYKTVSKFARTTEIYVSDITNKYRRLMEQTHTNYIKFFFDKLRKIGGEYQTTVHALDTIILELQNAPIKLSNDLKNDMFMHLNIDQPVGDNLLATHIMHLFQTRWKDKSKKSFDYYTNMWIDLSAKIEPTATDDEIVLQAAKLMTGFEIDYWKDLHREDFNSRFKSIIARLDEYSLQDNLAEHETKMTLKSADGAEREVVFDSGELTAMNQTMKNKVKSTLETFGQGISYEDKVQVLVALLGDLLEDK
ncbi:MAG: hypothetical protein RR413_03700 [Christensenellaceae bacterium]